MAPPMPAPRGTAMSRRLLLRGVIAVALGLSVWFLSDALVERTRTEQNDG